MALGNEGLRPDKSELRLRFGCGALLGALLGAGLVFRYSRARGPPVAAALPILGGGVLLGALARHYGDRFWYARRSWRER